MRSGPLAVMMMALALGCRGAPAGGRGPAGDRTGPAVQPEASASRDPVEAGVVSAERPCLASGWCWWNFPRGVEVQAAWGSAPDELWVAASERAMLRFDGVEWSARTVPLHAVALWGTGPAELFAAQRDGATFRWGGAEWTPLDRGPSLGRVSASGRAAWAVVSMGGALAHFDGTAWTQVALPALPGFPGLRAVAPWAESPDTVHVTATYDHPSQPVARALLRLAPDGWSAEPMAHAADIDGSGANDLWTSEYGPGEGTMGSLGWPRPTVSGFDGVSWSEQAPDVWGPLFVAARGDVWAGRFHLAGGRWTEHPGAPDRILWGSGPDDLWAVDDAKRRPDLLHWNGAGWAARVRLRGDVEVLGERGPDDAWGIGVADEGWVPIRWDGRSWRALSPSTVEPGGLPAVEGVQRRAVGFGTSASDLWVPVAGGFARWDGARWTSYPVPGAASGANGGSPMTGTGPSDVWAWNGSLVHWDGAAFRTVDPPPGDVEILDLWSPSEGILFALGYRAGPWVGRDRELADVIWRREGGRWSEAFATAPRLVGYDDPLLGKGVIWGPHGQEGWAVLSGTYRWDGASWVPSGPLRGGTCLWGSGPEDLWARAEGGLWHFDGASWTPLDVIEPWCGAGSWAIGNGGKLFRRSR